MCAKWYEDSENRVQILAERLESRKICDDSGKHIGWKSFERDDYLTAIESYLIFDYRIPEIERYRILNVAVDSLAETEKLSAKGLLGKISKEENLYLRKPTKSFVLATSISISYFEELQKRNRDIIMNPYLPRRFDRKDAEEEWKSLKIGELPKNHTFVRISVKARDEREAFNIAIDKLDLVRGIWNLLLNSNREILFGYSSGITKPLNKITLGAVHTLHLPSGKSASNDTFWYETDYVNNVKNISNRWSGIQRFEKKIKKKLSKHPYKSDIEDAIRRYVRALDFKDLHTSFLELWIVLEKLTSTTNAQYEKLVKRVAFLYEDVDSHKQIIQHLRLYRNSSVHTGQRKERIEKYVYQLKRYVEQLIHFNINNPFKFVSLEEISKFLDLPADSTLLKERIKLLNEEVKLLNKGVKFRP